MSALGSFRMINRILEYREKECIVTLCKLEDRMDLVHRYGLPAILLEIAAQSCALMNRIPDNGFRDCFLGKVKDIAFDDLSVVPSQVRTSAEWIFSSSKLTQYQGSVQSTEKGSIVRFNLYICTADELGGVSELRLAYWSRYLERLMREYSQTL